MLRSARQAARALTVASASWPAAPQLRPLVSSGAQEPDGVLSDDWFEEERGERGGWQPHIPIDSPRTLDDWNRLLNRLAIKKKGYLMRDVLEEMSLNGVRPNRRSYLAGLYASMRGRKLGDAMFFWEEMRRHGYEPDAAAYAALIAACGRCGQPERAVQLKQEMLEEGLEMQRSTYFALLSAFSEAGRLQEAQQVVQDMEAAGHLPDDAVYASLIATYPRLPPASVPADAEQQLLGLLEAACRRGAAAPPPLVHTPWGEPAPVGSSGVGLFLYNSLLHALATLGRHEAVLEVYRRVREDEGLEPDVATLSNVIRSHLVQALGTQRQPKGAQLEQLIEERLQQVDLGPFLAEVTAERAAQQAAIADTWGAAVASGEESEGEVEEEEGAGRRRGGGAEAAQLAGGGQGEQEEGLREPPEAGQPPAAPRQRGAGGGGGSSLRPGSEEEEERTLRRAQRRARGRVRFDIMAEHVDVDAWYQALHMFQEMLDRGLEWGPDVAYTLVRAALDLTAAGLEDATEVAHFLLDRFQQRGLFVDVDSGTELLAMAVRRDVRDLSVAHRVWDLMRRGGRFPRTPVAYRYMRALCQREPGTSKERIREVCGAILNDPGRSPAELELKAEAQRRQVIFGGAPDPRGKYTRQLAKADQGPGAEQQQHHQQQQTRARAQHHQQQQRRWR